MTTLDRDAAAATSRTLRDQEDVEARIRAICFKTGPPTYLGAELEWTLHHTAAPSAPLEAEALINALGPHAPTTLDPASPARPLPAGGTVTAEPGGQLEISSAPARSLAELHTTVEADRAHLADLLADAGFTLGEYGIDPHREPRRLLSTPRYRAMQQAFDARGPHGRTMMCSTAGLQVCLDAGPADQVATRWATVGALGPPLIAAFANSARHAGRDTGRRSARMAAWWGMDPRLTHPVPLTADPADGWVAYALAAPVLCIRRDGDCWDPPAGLTLRDWADGALSFRPTADDVDYHLSLLFPPVRPRGYLEVRYLDAQPGADWIVPVAVLTALLADPATTEAALDLAGPAAGRWVAAGRHGLADPVIRSAATEILDLACRRLDRTDLPAPVRAQITETVQGRLRDAAQAEEQR
jgi:glutamate--cysteine ligase